MHDFDVSPLPLHKTSKRTAKMAPFLLNPKAPFIDNTELKDLVSYAKSGAQNWKHLTKSYFLSLFPIFQWIGRYNWTWFLGDLVCGLALGFMILPQGLAQAKIATLPAEYGLYTAFTGLVIYAFFATSKDVTIGPTAVLSLLTSQLIDSSNRDAAGNPIYAPETFALTLACVSGVYMLIIGFLRLGMLADFIPGAVISGFTTGAAISIIVQQLPSLFGIKGIKTNSQPTHMVFKDFCASLGSTQWDVAIGLSACAILVLLKYLKDRYSKKNKFWFWVGVSRNGIVLVLYLIISVIVAKTSPVDGKGNPIMKFNIVGFIPSGFKAPQVPQLDSGILSRVMVPAMSVTLVAIVEHVGIVRSFGRKFGYNRNIRPSQEIIAVGLSNFLGSFLNGYPATGSFSRSAVKAASGVRTPADGFITATVVVFALYLLTSVFYYIPSALLAAIIICAISDLISRYDTFIEFWNVSLLDFLVFITAIFVTIFAGIETGIFVSVSLAALILLLRLARPKVLLLETESQIKTEPGTDHSDAIMVFRLQESLTYPNAQHVSNRILKIVHERTRFTGVKRTAGERLWFEDAEEREAERGAEAEKLGSLKAIVFDFSAVNTFDSAGYQVIQELRTEVAKHAGRPVFFYFVNVRPPMQRVVANIMRTLYPEEILPLINQGNLSARYQSTEPSDLFFVTIQDAVSRAKLCLSANLSLFKEDIVLAKSSDKSELSTEQEQDTHCALV
eukprot:Colp12_sorted_trinity150504_noHs@10697